MRKETQGFYRVFAKLLAPAKRIGVIFGAEPSTDQIVDATILSMPPSWIVIDWDKAGEGWMHFPSPPKLPRTFFHLTPTPPGQIVPRLDPPQLLITRWRP